MSEEKQNNHPLTGDPAVGSSDLVRRLRDPEAYVDACDEAADLIEQAEVLLCNALPMGHCSETDWDKLILDWRNRKHGVSPNEAGQARREEPRT